MAGGKLPVPLTAAEFMARYQAGQRDFHSAQFEDGADLKGVELSDVSLYGAKLWRPNLVGARLFDCTLDHAVLEGPDLRDARLVRCTLRQARVAFTRHDNGARVPSEEEHETAEEVDADLRGASLAGCTLPDSHLVLADMRNAILDHADLKGANLQHASFDDATLAGADLERADLRFATGIRFNNTLLRGARLSPHAGDPWSVLRRQYTGTMFSIHLMLFFLFLVPYVARTAMWLGVQRAEVQLAAVRNQALVLAAQQGGPARSAQVENVLAQMRLTPCLAPECQEWRVWHVLLGLDRGWSHAHLVALALALVVYNLARALLTWRVGVLRDAEDRSGYTPSWIAEDVYEGRPRWQDPPRFPRLSKLRSAIAGYGVLWQVHQLVMRPLVVVAVVSLVVHILHWLRTPIWLPVNG